MGFCGDAMNIENSQLQTLLTLQAKLVTLRKLKSQIDLILEGKKIEEIRVRLLSLSADASQKLSAHEELQRDLKRAENDLDLVVARIEKDQARLSQATDTKVISGVQHELESLGKRRSELEDAQLELMERVEVSSAEQEQIAQQRSELQSDLAAATEEAKQDLALTKSEHEALALEISGLRSEVDTELLELFEKLASRATAVGVLRGSTCGACNMNLTSTALGQIGAVPMNELARCPECSAIMVRE